MAQPKMFVNRSHDDTLSTQLVHDLRQAGAEVL